MSLTEALRTGAPGAFGALYDEHAEQLYAYCHIMIGDEAADAVRDTFIAVARHPGTAPDDDALPVWLYALARAECVRRGALVRKPAMAPSADPLRRALARLRPEHREALALSTALETDEIARVIGVAADTAEMLVRVSQRRLEQAAASVLGARAVHDEAMLAALSGGNLHRLVMRGYEAPPRQRERVLFSCAAAERAADGALLFDQDGMPIPLDGLFGTAEDATHPFAQVADLADEPTGPMRHAGSEPESSVSSSPSAFERRRTSRGGGVHVVHARSKKTPLLSRKRDGLVEVAGLAACVAAATSVLALWPSTHDNGASNMDGSSLFLHRGAPASRSAQPTPPVGNGTPPQGATSKPGASPSPTPAKAAPATTAPPAASDQPAPPPADGSNPSHPTPPPNDPPPSDPPPSDPPPSDPPTSEPPTTTPTPTPSDSPTDSPSPDTSTP